MLSCPICLARLELTDTAALCANSHHFDRARQGYLHLLPVQHKASRAPGDSAEMVTARRDFLSSGHYQPHAQQLADYSATIAPRTWLDIGCGEGYYTDHLAKSLPLAQGYGLDVSKDAIKQACRRSKQIQWLVASMAQIPLSDHSCDLLTSVFSPYSWAEILRLLSKNGTFLRLGPAQDHLLELRSKLYEQVRPYDDAKHLQNLPAQLKLARTEYMRYRLNLSDSTARANLLAMTPHGWRINEERKRSIIEQPIDVTVAVRFDWIQPV